MTTVADLKAELNIAHSEDDAILARKLAAATDHVERYIGSKLDDLVLIPAGVEEAILRLAAHYFDNGDGMPEGLIEKLNPHRAWSF